MSEISTVYLSFSFTAKSGLNFSMPAGKQPVRQRMPKNYGKKRLILEHQRRKGYKVFLVSYVNLSFIYFNDFI